MRGVLLLLVLANVVLFFWWQGMLAAWIPGGRDPERVARQVAAERLTVLPPAGAGVPPAAQGAGASAMLCHELGPLDSARREAVLALIQGLGPTLRADAGETGIRVLIDAAAEPGRIAEWLGAIAVEARQAVRPCVPQTVLPANGTGSGREPAAVPTPPGHSAMPPSSAGAAPATPGDEARPSRAATPPARPDSTSR